MAAFARRAASRRLGRPAERARSPPAARRCSSGRRARARPPGLQAALRTAELLIKTGFALVVLDLDGAPARELARLSPSVWTRLARALREARATALLLGSHGAAGTFASLGARAERTEAFFDRGLFEGLESRLEVVRRRTGPPPADLHFSVFQRP
jgi:hypothetical protein